MKITLTQKEYDHLVKADCVEALMPVKINCKPSQANCEACFLKHISFKITLDKEEKKK